MKKWSVNLLFAGCILTAGRVDEQSLIQRYYHYEAQKRRFQLQTSPNELEFLDDSDICEKLIEELAVLKQDIVIDMNNLPEGEKHTKLTILFYYMGIYQRRLQTHQLDIEVLNYCE